MTEIILEDKTNETLTASKRNSPAAGATQGYIRLLAIR